MPFLKYILGLLCHLQPISHRGGGGGEVCAGQAVRADIKAQGKVPWDLYVAMEMSSYGAAFLTQAVFLTSSINTAHVKRPLEVSVITAAAGGQFERPAYWMLTNLAARSSQAHEEAFLGTIS